MRALVVCDNEAISMRLRALFQQEGFDCFLSALAPNAIFAGQQVEERPELLVLVLPSDPEVGLSFLREARSQFQGRILVVGPAVDPQIILRALREGADQFLDKSQLETEIEGVLKRLRLDANAQAEPGRLISLLAASGGSGSSTLAVNLATVFAQEHKSCVLFDLKPGVGDLAALLDLKPTYTFADLCLDGASPDRLMFQRSLAQHASGVHLLAPPRTLADLRRVTPAVVRQTLLLARTLFPYAVVDLDDCFHEEQAQALRQADVVLLVLRLDFTSLRNARRILEQLEQIGVGRERVRLVANRYGQPKELPYAKAEEALGVKIGHYVPDDPKTINRANNNGMPAVLESPRANVSRSIARLAVAVNGRHHSS